MFTKAILLNGQRPGPVVFPPVPPDDRKAILSPRASSREVWGTAFYFAICLIIHSARLTLKLFLVCSQPDLFWDEAENSFPLPCSLQQLLQAASLRENAKPPRICPFGTENPKGDAGSLGDLDTCLHIPVSRAPPCSEKDGFGKVVSKPGCWTPEAPGRIFKIKLAMPCLALLDSDLEDLGSFFFFFFFWSFVFLGPHPQHMEVPRLEGKNRSYNCLPTPQPHQHQI